MKTILALAAMLVFALPVAAQNNCNIELKPLTPLGCTDTTPICLCGGSRCHWTWACVPQGLPSMTAPVTAPSWLPSGIDPTIPLQVRPVQVPDLMEAYRKALEIRNLQLQEQALQPLRQQNQQMMAAPSDIHPSIPVPLPEGKHAPTLLRPGEGVTQAPIPLLPLQEQNQQPLPISSNPLAKPQPTTPPVQVAAEPGSPSMYDAGGHVNCRWWAAARAAAPTPLHEVYLLALQEGLLLGAAEGVLVAMGDSPEAEKSFNRVFSQYFPQGDFSLTETAKGIDTFCAAPENLPLKVVDVLRITVMRFNGSEPAEIERESARLRRGPAVKVNSLGKLKE